MSSPRVLADGALEGLSALVTGAGSGIGRAVTLRLAELGAVVSGVGRRAKLLHETGDLVRRTTGRDLFRAHAVDIRDRAAVDVLVREVGETRGIGALVNNAGGQFFARATDISPRGWDAVLDLNLSANFHLTRAAHTYLAAARGAVLNVSLSGVERGGMGMAHSIAARAGVLGLTRTLALEWAADGIRVNCLGPGTVVTSALDEEAGAHVEDNLIGRATPMRRATSAAEVAELVAFLVGPAGAMMTGQLVQIDGGAHLGVGLHMLPEAYR